MRTGIDAICAVLGLGVPCGPPEPVSGGSSAAGWRVLTARGRWLVKAMPAPAAWQLHEMRVSGRLERAAYEAGVPMPTPAQPAGTGPTGTGPNGTGPNGTGPNGTRRNGTGPNGTQRNRTGANGTQHNGTGPDGTGAAETAGYWVRFDENGRYARASAWVDGSPSGEHVSESLADWLGRTVAAIERLDLPGDPAAEAAYPLHAVPDWREWLDQAAAAGILDRTQALEVLSSITDGTALVREALAGGPVFRLAHRDVSRSNIVVTTGGPVLIDFDYAGPEVPWWEFVQHCFDLASPALGERPPEPGLVHVALAAYAEAGGAGGPARVQAFAGLVRAMLGTLAYELWLATGHRTATTDRRAVAVQSGRRLATRLPVILNSLDSWSRMIR